MTTATLNTAKNTLDLVNAGVKVIALIVGMAIAWTVVQGNIVRHNDRITAVEADLKQFKADVQTDLREVNAKVHDIAVGVATLVERSKPKDKP